MGKPSGNSVGIGIDYKIGNGNGKKYRNENLLRVNGKGYECISHSRASIL